MLTQLKINQHASRGEVNQNTCHIRNHLWQNFNFILPFVPLEFTTTTTDRYQSVIALTLLVEADVLKSHSDNKYTKYVTMVQVEEKKGKKRKSVTKVTKQRPHTSSASMTTGEEVEVTTTIRAKGPQAQIRSQVSSIRWGLTL